MAGIPVLVRIEPADLDAVKAWVERQNESRTKRAASLRRGKTATVTVPDFVRQAVTEKLAHIARSGKR